MLACVRGCSHASAGPGPATWTTKPRHPGNVPAGQAPGREQCTPLARCSLSGGATRGLLTTLRTQGPGARTSAASEPGALPPPGRRVSLLSLAHLGLACPCTSAPGGNEQERLLQRADVSKMLLEVPEVTMWGPSRGAGSAHAWGSVPRREEGSSHWEGERWPAHSRVGNHQNVPRHQQRPCSGPQSPQSTSVSCPRGAPARTCPADPLVDGARSLEGTVGGRVSARWKGHRRRAQPSADGKAAVHLPKRLRPKKSRDRRWRVKGLFKMVLIQTRSRWGGSG